MADQPKRKQLLVGKAEVIDLVRADVRAMLENEGIYIGGDVKMPHVVVPLASQGGKVFSMKIDEELTPGRFLPTLTLHGPYHAARPAPPMPGWQPIATAPQTTAGIIVFGRMTCCGPKGGNVVTVVGRMNGRWIYPSDHTFEFTHWMELPDPPAAGRTH